MNHAESTLLGRQRPADVATVAEFFIDVVNPTQALRLGFALTRARFHEDLSGLSAAGFARIDLRVDTRRESLRISAKGHTVVLDRRNALKVGLCLTQRLCPDEFDQTGVVRALIKCAARLLPAGHQERCAEEYAYDLHYLAQTGSSGRTRLAYAIRIFLRVPLLHWELREPRRERVW